ncbi:hypothetical protein [Actinoplanes sp. TFC3]|uniref:hypothetical protein n=1 Tax=Actinoplanes sp. TFC3 TaxID=1710355 RepID=UPI000833899A|nr:hypothetical protein [Actinoplanes sp. TFC3]
MPPSDGWYLLGPFIAVALVAFLGSIFWRMGLHWRDEPEPDLFDGLGIFQDFRYGDDYGLLCPAAVTDNPDEAQEIRDLLTAANIKCTSAVRPDGRLFVLVFPETAEEARRLVGSDT